MDTWDIANTVNAVPIYDYVRAKGLALPSLASLVANAVWRVDYVLAGRLVRDWAELWAHKPYINMVTILNGIKTAAHAAMLDHLRSVFPVLYDSRSSFGMEYTITEETTIIGIECVHRHIGYSHKPRRCAIHRAANPLVVAAAAALINIPQIRLLEYALETSNAESIHRELSGYLFFEDVPVSLHRSVSSIILLQMEHVSLATAAIMFRAGYVTLESIVDVLIGEFLQPTPLRVSPLVPKYICVSHFSLDSSMATIVRFLLSADGRVYLTDRTHIGRLHAAALARWGTDSGWRPFMQYIALAAAGRDEEAAALAMAPLA
jgi:hypothetical protein